MRWLKRIAVNSPENRWTAFALLLILGYSLTVSFRGINYSSHWDENVTFESVITAVETGSILPSKGYVYPSFMFDASLLSIAPDILWHRFFSKGDSESPPIWKNVYTLIPRMRKTFTVLSHLGVLWVFLFILTVRKSRVEALLGAAFLAFSFEWHYHARWIASDVLMAQFSVLTIFLLFAAREAKSSLTARRLLWGSAATAAAACGTKYPGGALLIPIVMTAISEDRKFGASLFYLLAQILGIFVVVFFAITPGALLESSKFVHDVSYVIGVYDRGWNAYSVSPWIEHPSRILSYFALSAPSPYLPFSLLVSGLAILGGFDFWKKDHNSALIFFSCPAFYLLFFSGQHVMIVRNLMIFLPFLVILAARGYSVLVEHIPSKNISRFVLSPLIVLGLLANCVWLAHAAQTIRKRLTVNYLEEFLSYVDANSREKIYISPKIAQGLRDEHYSLDGFTTEAADSFERVAFFVNEIPNNSIMANRYRRSIKWFGPKYVNYLYYTTWPSNEQLVVYPADEAGAILKHLAPK